MDKNLAGIIGAVSAIAMGAPAHAAVSPQLSLSAAMQAGSYADLLKPIANATALLQAADAASAEVPVQDVQYYPPPAAHHHHHHHHRRVYRRRYHHHHHHHHHHQALVIPLPRD